MKFILTRILIACFPFALMVFNPGIGTRIVAPGQQPQLSIDNTGLIRLVFGRNDSIFYSISSDKGLSFSKPALVSRIPGMHLGMSRGPQLASSKNNSLITAMDKEGNIHSFLLNHTTGRWVPQSMVNDVRGTAPEGLMALAADDNDNFYAVWLDLRNNKKNNIFFTSLAKNTGKWSKNKLLYTSPDGHVCECCKPNIAVKGDTIAIMFRNWVNGSRDMYTMESKNNGKDFTGAVKLGKGTWKLNACPMDGGSMAIDKSGGIHTVWRREGLVYYARPNAKEIEIGKGKNGNISIHDNNIFISLQDAGNIKVVDMNNKKETIIGKGNYSKHVVFDDGSIFCVWEENGEIKYKNI